MRDPARIPRIAAKIERLWQRYPDLRFGQFYHWLEHQMAERGLPVFPVTDADRHRAYDPFQVEDGPFEEVLDAMIAEHVGGDP